MPAQQSGAAGIRLSERLSPDDPALGTPARARVGAEDPKIASPDVRPCCACCATSLSASCML